MNDIPTTIRDANLNQTEILNSSEAFFNETESATSSSEASFNETELPTTISEACLNNIPEFCKLL